MMTRPITSTTAPMLRLWRGILVAITVSLMAALAAVASPASAHGGPINAEVSQDGLGGVYVSFFYQKDAHPVEVIVEATVEGRSSDGQVVEAVPLTSASQGVGIWETASGTFTPGKWDLTVRVTSPTPYQETMPIEIAMAEVIDDDHTAAEDAATAAATGPTAQQWWPLAAGIGIVVVAGVVVLLVIRRRRVPAHR